MQFICHSSPCKGSAQASFLCSPCCFKAACSSRICLWNTSLSAKVADEGFSPPTFSCRRTTVSALRP